MTRVFMNLEMEERESLKRQIELLQNLIDHHKSVHGNAPSSTVQRPPPRPVPARGFTFSYPAQTGLDAAAARPVSHWRKKYSLSNRGTVSSSRPAPSVRPASSSSDLVGEARLEQEPAAASLRAVSSRPGPAVSHSHPAPRVREQTGGHLDGLGRNQGSSRLPGAGPRPLSESIGLAQTGCTVAAVKAGTRPVSGGAQKGPVTKGGPSQSGGRRPGRVPSSLGSPLKGSFTGVGNSECSPSPEVPETSPVVVEQGAAQLQLRPLFRVSGSPSEPNIASTVLTDGIPHPPPLESSQLSSLASGNVISPRAKMDSVKLQVPPSVMKRSQFTWVKSSQAQAGASHTGTGAQPTSILASSTDAVSASRKTPRRLSLQCPRAIKTTKYTWVSAVAGRPAKLPRKPLSPRALDVPKRKAAAEGAKKPRYTPPRTARTKSGPGACSGSASQAHASWFSWKAGSTRGTSQYRWTNGPKAATGPRTPSSWAEHGPVSPSPPGSKLKSRMNSGRGRTPSSGSGSGFDWRGVPGTVLVNSRYSLSRRTATPSKSPSGLRKSQTKVLVPFGKHKLRRLSTAASPGLSRTSGAVSLACPGSSSPSLRSPFTQRVIKTRYKIVTRRGAGGPSHVTQFSPSLSWRTRKLHSARALLQSRLRTPPSDRPWRGRGMRVIGGALYQVSANKLRRTGSPALRHRAAGKWSSPQDTSPHAPPFTPGRTSSTQHLASRVIQRSRAIIRNARQRKRQSREFCMYYTRFGKCNRQEKCPYIHDPEKVAVCTRFLRGTCKQTDGTCPFSHKVSKEKMPVCSYYLKGICSNANCPYSHVYVSRKAAVCQDFVRGYCPQGEKCKKKHTLLCPDFSKTGSCPRGSQCKLQHRQRTKGTGPPKRARVQEAAERSEPGSPSAQLTDCSQAVQETPVPGPQKLPSFISLSSSPETPEAAAAPSVEGLEVTEKKLQIKPRF